MKMKTLLLLTVLSLHMSVEALLPPFYQSLKEYKALLDDPKFTESFTSADIILDIKREDKGFTIITNRNKLRVDVVSTPEKRIGPEEFSLKFYKPEPLY